MHSAGANDRTTISAAGARFGSTKLAAAAVRCALTLAVLSTLLLIVARPAQAQTETVLYNFTGDSDGVGPEYSLTSDGKGNFYGTTPLGGPSEAGTVYELSPNGSGGWNETVLYSFPELADGADPSSNVIFDSVGNLYGTTAIGGTNFQGTVFELSPEGASWKETVLYNFGSNCCDGVHPAGGLIMDSAGNLYGTAGNVFELTPSGGGWTEQVIYNINPEADTAGLTMDMAGNIFGVENSRVIGNSTVFELSSNGNGGWNPTVIYTFPGLPKSVGTLVPDPAGNLYGAADGDAEGCGKIYKLSLGTNEKWTAKTLYSFIKGGADGCYPSAGIVFDAAGNIYGPTDGGGAYNHGTVFELVAPVGKDNHKYTEKSLWSFNLTDGALLFGSLILDSDGNLYGTAYAGGTNDDGLVFEVTP